MSFLKAIASKAEELDLFVGTVKESSEIFPFIFHIQASLKSMNGAKVFGKGIGQTETQAYNKALGEALERLCFRHDGRFDTSNGIALHTNAAIAQESAKFELLERDAYLSHFYTKTPFFRHNEADMEKSTFKEAYSTIHGHGFDLFVGRLSSIAGLYISIAICIDTNLVRNSGLKIGLGCHYLVEKSLNSAIFEAIALIPMIVAGTKLPVLTRDEFYKCEGRLSVNDFIGLSTSEWALEILKPLIDNVCPFVSSDFNPKIEYIPLRMEVTASLDIQK